jgi:UDP:flavonoid glycosyltransferase YjiC (YdhE family)
MARILAYTSPALGHLLPISALLLELASRGHTIHVRTLSVGVEIGQRLGFATDAIDPLIEEIEHDDWKATNPVAALRRSVAVFDRRAVGEVADLADAVARVRPDALLVDVNCWGALSAAEAGGIPWACFAPYTPPLRSPGVPPFGLGLRPLTGALGRMRDAVVQAVVVGRLEKVMLPPINAIRANVGVRPIASVDEFLRRAPLMLLASGTPFQYPPGDWGDAVQMIGPCMLDPGRETTPDWLASIDRPIVLVTTSSEKQADTGLVPIAIAGTSWLGVGRRITVRIGEPIPPTRRRSREGVAEMTARCQAALGAMVADQPEVGRPGPFGRWLTELFNEWPEGSREAARAASEAPGLAYFDPREPT